MSRKARERLLQQIREHAERLNPNDESLTRAEVQDALREGGSDPEALREWLNSAARALAAAQRAKGKPGPDYLQEVIDLSSPADHLPSNEKTALQKAGEWIRSLRGGPGLLLPDAEIIRLSAHFAAAAT
jgi:hypothetical protein